MKSLLIGLVACYFGDINYPSSLQINPQTLMVNISGHRDSIRGYATAHYNPFRTQYSLANGMKINVENGTYRTEVCQADGLCQSCR